MSSLLRQFLVFAILLSAIVAVYSLENATDVEKSVNQDSLPSPDASEMARRRRHRFGNHLCKNLLVLHFTLIRLVRLKFYFRFNSVVVLCLSYRDHLIVL